jgi:hypothetical protein
MFHSVVHVLRLRHHRNGSDVLSGQSSYLFLQRALINVLLLALLFFGLLCYLFASLFELEPRTHNIDILWVDYDHGAVGDAVRAAYASLHSNKFPTLLEQPEAIFPSSDDLKKAICRSHYWAALYTLPGASDKLSATILESNTSQYEPSHVLSYIWNEARYPIVMDRIVANNLQALSDNARVEYVARNIENAVSFNFSAATPASFAAASTPWHLSSINIQPTTQGTRNVYNTVLIVLILMQEFLFLNILNALCVQFNLRANTAPFVVIALRVGISGVFTLLSSLLITCAIWIFAGAWHLSSTQFALNWMTLWLLAHINFLTLDIVTVWICPRYVPMVLISWAVINVTSTILPFELSSPFYRWAYAVPAHEAYEVLTNIWSRGCNSHLHIALPTLFAYEVCGILLSGLGVFYRCRCRSDLS